MIIKTNRPAPRVQILRGWDLVSTATLNQVHPVKEGVTILSGQIIHREWNNTLNRYEWELGCEAGKAPFIAFQDSYEADVVATDGLTGISISGDYEIQTAHYKTGETYNVDTLLTFDGVTGDVKPAAEGDLILGRVSKIRGVKQLNPVSLSRTQMFFENSETTPANSNVIIFETANMGYLQAVDAVAP